MTTNKFKIIILLVLLSTAVFSLQAENIPFDISAAFIGPADPIYSWWGHVAIIVEDRRTGAGRYYDYGNFSFDQDSFINNFVMGRLYFEKNVSNPDPQLRYSAYLNRDVTIYKLNIPDDRKIEMIRFLENDVKPENRVYLYDHFYDNCSTRIRDILDAASKGELAKAGAADSGRSLRQQLRRFTYSSPLTDWLLNFALKGNIDQSADVWESMFLPSELEAAISKLMITDSNGQMVPFAAGKTIYSRAEGRPLIPNTPPVRWPRGLIAGAILAAAGYLLLRSAKTSPAARRCFAILSALISLVFGLAGTLLLFMAGFTDHSFAYWNQNLLFINPFLLITLAFSVRLLFSRKADLRSVNICWRITAVGALLSIALKIIPFFRQDNWSSLFLILLPAVIFGGLLRKIRIRTSSEK